MNNKRLLFLSMVALTLTIGVIIGTIVSGGVKATFQEKPATIVIPDPVSLSNAFSQIAAQLEPAVVKIQVEMKAPTPVRGRQNQRAPQLPPGFEDLFPQFGAPDQNPRRPRGGQGTGFVVDKAGYILTNHHVIDGADEITVFLSDDSKHAAKFIGSDEGTDLGLIKIDAGRDLQVARFGNSDAVKVGDWVLAIGSPFGFDHTVTTGIISAKGRSNGRFGVKNEFVGLQRFLQTDAAINPGNSGGPLVNMSGEVIGINTAIVSGTESFAGLGFALPSNTAIGVYNQLSQNGKVSRGSIGVQLQDENDPVALAAMNIQAKGAVVLNNVYPGTPAAKAGLQVHDVITDINGVKITTSDQLMDVILGSPVGSSVKLGILREGKAQNVSVVIGERAEVLSTETELALNPRETASPRRDQNSETSRLGIAVQGVTAQMSRQFGISGVEIVRVEDDSVADDEDLEEGMVITGYISGGRTTPIANVAAFRAFEQQLRPGSSVILIVRVPNAYDVNVRVPLVVK